MIALLYVYLVIGLVFFSVCETATAFGNAFTGERWTLPKAVLRFLLFGLLWLPVAIYVAIATRRNH